MPPVSLMTVFGMEGGAARCPRLISPPTRPSAKPSTSIQVIHSDAQRRALKRRLHAGELVSPYKNLYADRTLWNTMTREQQSLQVIRALSAIHPQWVFAGLSAACVYGLQHNYSLHDGTVHIASKSGIGGGDEAAFS